MSNQKVWITKYALTRGVFSISAEIEGEMATEHKGSYMLHYHGDDWHTNENDAYHRAETMRKARIASLRKQIAKLEKLRFYQ